MTPRARLWPVSRSSSNPGPHSHVRRRWILLREIAGRLQSQVKQSTRAINRLHNILARTFPELAQLTDDIATGWVLRLLMRYLERPNGLHLTRCGSLERIPYLRADQAAALRQAAKTRSTARGDTAEILVRNLVADVQRSRKNEKELRKLLVSTFDELPPSAHRQVATVPGIGPTTAAILVAKIVDIDRFATPGKLVSYFGAFPEEHSSGVDKKGNSLPLGARSMSTKGNDLVRGHLWNACCAPFAATRPFSALSPPESQRKTWRRRDGALHDASCFTWSSLSGRPIVRSTPLTFTGMASAMPHRRRQPPSSGPQGHHRPTKKPWATTGLACEESGHHGLYYRSADRSV